MKPGDVIKWNTVNGPAIGRIIRSAGWLVELKNGRKVIIDEDSVEVVNEQEKEDEQ